MCQLVVPCYRRSHLPNNPQHVVGYLLVKRLIVVDPDDARELSSFVLGKPVFFPPGGDVFNLLKEFQVRACSSALVGMVGMVAPGGQA